jgi:Exo-beta-D-glucosaminidase Ig-fold domain
VQHDLGKGPPNGNLYPGQLNKRYGMALNLADFVRKAQLANYEAFRAMYEGYFIDLFHPTTGILTWMSNPAQPSFVWQLYSWDLEPNSSLFATRKACEPVHIMLNESTWHIHVINNQPLPLSGATVSVAVYNMDGTVAHKNEVKIEAPASAAIDVGAMKWPNNLTKIHFVKLQLHTASGQLLSDNFYWRGTVDKGLDLQDLGILPMVKLEVLVKRRDAGGKCLLDVTVRNPSDKIALMAHLQLRRKSTGERVLPVYYSDNYISLVPQESRTATIETAASDLKGDKPLLVLDGWNIDVTPVASGDCEVALNKNAQGASWPVTNISVKKPDPLGQIKGVR